MKKHEGLKKLGVEGHWEGRVNPLPETLLKAIQGVESIQFDFLNEIRARNALVSLSERCLKLKEVHICVLHSDGDLNWFDTTIQKLLCGNCLDLKRVEIKGEKGSVLRLIKSWKCESSV